MDDSDDPFESLEKHIWTAKEFFKRRFTKNEDEYVAASDVELDTKLETFKSLKETTGELMKALRGYHDNLADLAHYEDNLSQLLQYRSHLAKMNELRDAMIAMGKTLHESSSDRVQLKKHFSRLSDEVTTFRTRAITDCEKTVSGMEKERIKYRGSLSWMLEVSERLNPENRMQMQRFRKVQDHCKTMKENFDKTKLNTLEKIDLLAVSRQQMFSQSLGGYQKALKLYHTRMFEIFSALENQIDIPTDIKYEHLKELNALVDQTSKMNIAEHDELISMDHADEGTGEEANKIGQLSDLLALPDSSTDFEPATSEDLFQGWEDNETDILREVFSEIDAARDVRIGSSGSVLQLFQEEMKTKTEDVENEKPRKPNSQACPNKKRKDTVEKESLDTWYKMLNEIDLMANSSGTAGSQPMVTSEAKQFSSLI